MTLFKSTQFKPSLPGKSKALALLCALSGTPAWASNLIVNDLTDITFPGDGMCTLREAIANANANSDTTSLDCASGAGFDTISFSVNGTVLLDSTLSISDPAGVTLDGVGRSVTLSGNYAVRVILVNPGAALTVKNLTVANGFDNFNGGGIYNQFGNLTVVNSTFSGNSAARNGGAIANHRDSALATPNGNLSIINSTFSGNSASFGGAIMNNGLSTVSIVNSTIVGNSVSIPVCPIGFVCIGQASGGGIYNSGTLNLDNSIVAGNASPLGSPDIGGSINSARYNLISDFQLHYVWNGIGPLIPLNGNNGNITGVDVNTLLDTTLANNGGPTQTLALLANSPAIDGADDNICSNTPVSNLDQRGIVRPQGPHCDIGAFEVAVVSTVDLSISETATPNPAMVRDTLTWTINVTNSSTADASGVKVIDTLPVSGLSSISATASQGNCSAPLSGVITCNLGNLSPSNSATISVKGIPSKVGTLSNQVTVSGDQVDNLQANNTVIQTTTVQALLCKGLKPTIVGTPGPDTITGTRGRDIIHGLAGNDTIYGGNDNDIICGGEGHDSLIGDSGNDALDGGAGTDSCNGGKGTDTAVNCEANIAIP